METAILRPVIAVLVALFSLNAWAYDVEIDGIYYNLVAKVKMAEVTSGDNKYTGDITIPASFNHDGTTYIVTTIGASAFDHCSGLTSVDIPNSVTTIGDYAFSGCSGLTSVIIPNSVTNISKCAFMNCSGLTSVIIPNSVTTIGSSAFKGCSSLTSVNIPNSVTSIGMDAFRNCSGLASATIDDGTTYLEVSSAIFNDCPIKEIYLGRGCASTYSPFQGLKDLTSLTIGNNVTSILDFRGCSNLTSLTIKDGTEALTLYTSSSSAPFEDCPIRNLYLGRKIRRDTHKKFSLKDFKSLSSLTIGNSFTSIGEDEFSGCTNLFFVSIPNSVTSIGSGAFSGCSGLTTVTIPNSVTSIGSAAFYKCSGLTSVSIPNSVTSIGSSAFESCSGLTSVSIPNSVTSIGSAAFSSCNGLTSVSIPNSVTSIGKDAFYGCSGLTAVGITDIDAWCKTSFNNQYSNPLFYAHHLYLNGEEVTDLTIPNSVTNIGEYAFSGCSGLTTVTIPNSVTSIESFTFMGCRKLTSVVIPNSVTDIGEHAFSGCSGLTSVSIPNSVTSIGKDAFYGCSGLTSVEIPNSVTSIGKDAFSACNGLTSVSINDGTEVLALNSSSETSPFKNCPIRELYIGRNISYSSSNSPFKGMQDLSSLTIGSNVTSISDYAFSDCTNLHAVDMSDDIVSISIAYHSFPSNTKLYVNKGSKTLLTFWNAKKNSSSTIYKPYDKSTDQELLPPSFNVATTQTTATVEIENWYVGYIYQINNEITNKNEFTYTRLKPYSNQQLTLVISKDDVQHVVTGSFTTKGLSPQIQFTSTASSISASGDYTEEDAKVVSQSIQISNGPVVEGNHCFLSGLTPGRTYTVKYDIEVDYGGEKTAVYTGTSSAWTANLKFDNAQPKVVSEGNIIVSSTCSNLDPAETTMGFEWRCTDWTDEFPSNRGSAFLYDGVLEGMIKNLNVNKLWKFRPYYVSASGNYTYGDWTGIDPTNTSYFEPTVRTYAKVSIEGNTAEVNGYTLKGTDEVTTTGFKYWKSKSGVSQRSAVAIPSDAITVTTTGQQAMSAKLTELAYNAEYTYVAFATTADGSTYYGAEQSFITGEDPNSTDIESIEIEPSSTSTGEPVTIVARYNMNGQQISTPQKGVNILRYSDGSSKKVQVK